MKINKGTIKYNFTLLELIVSMGIFSILMLMLMQFFSSTQKVWTAAEKRNVVYGDARVAMDLMSSMLQTSFYQYNAVPFYIDTTNTNFNTLYMVSKTGTKLYSYTTGTETYPKSDLFEVKYYVDLSVDKRFTLRVNMIGDDKTSYIFAKYPLDKANLVSKLDAAPDNTPAEPTKPCTDSIIPYVTSLTFTPYKKDTSSGLLTSADYDRFPYAIQIKLTLMDKEAYVKWKALLGNESSMGTEPAAAKKIREENQRTFTRMVYLGDRNE